MDNDGRREKRKTADQADRRCAKKNEEQFGAACRLCLCVCHTLGTRRFIKRCFFRNFIPDHADQAAGTPSKLVPHMRSSRKFTRR